MLRPARTAAALALLALLASPGCRAPSRPSTRPPTAPPTAVRSLTPRIDLALDERRTFVERAADGTRAFFQGGVRFTWRDGEVHLAADGFLRPIARAVHAEHGWVFVAFDGATARSDTYLGPLTSLGPVHLASVPPPCLGRAAVVDVDGRVLTTDGRGPWAPSALVLPAWQAVFRTALHGAAVVVGGDVHQTTDGGATWCFVPGARGIGDLACNERSIFPANLSQQVRLTDRDTFEPQGEPRDFPLDEDLDEYEEVHLDEGRVAWDLFQRNAGDATLVGGELPDGAWALSDGRDLLELDPVTLRERRRHLRIPGGAVVGWQIEQVTSGSHGSTEIYRHPLRTEALVGAYTVYAANDEVGAAIDRERERSLLTGPVPGPAAPLAIDEQVDVVEAVDARWVWGRAREGETVRAVRIDRANGHVEPLLPGRAARGHFLRGGTFVGVEGSSLVRVAPDGGVETRPLPDGATGARFVDALRGTAWGSAVAQLWVTADGGARWQPLGLRVDGVDGDERYILRMDEAEPRCTAWGCSFGYIVWQGWEGPWASPHLLAAPLPRAAPAATTPAPPLPTWSSTVTCRPTALLSPPWTARPGERIARSPQGEARVRRRPGGDQVVLDVEWRAFRAGRVVVTRSPSRPFAAESWSGAVRAVHVDPTRVVLVEDNPPGERPGDGVLEATSTRLASTVAFLRDDLRWQLDDPDARTFSAAAGEGRVSLSQWPSAGEHEPRPVVADVHGLSVVRRPGPTLPVVAFARQGGLPGVLLWTSEPTATLFVPMDSNRPTRPSSLVFPRSLPLCRGASDGADAIVLPPIPYGREDEERPPRVDTLAVVEMGAAPCVREVQHRDGREGYRVTVGADGALAGVRFSGRGVERVTCVVH